MAQNLSLEMCDVLPVLCRAVLCFVGYFVTNTCILTQVLAEVLKLFLKILSSYIRYGKSDVFAEAIK